MAKELVLGEEAKILAKTAKAKIQELYDKMPNDEATIGAHQDYLNEIKRFKKDFGVIFKYINRQFVIANTQLLKAKQRDRADNQMNIFELADPKEDGEVEMK